jgi:hypothetical protein
MAASSTYQKRREKFQAILKGSKGPLARALAKVADARLTGSQVVLEPAESRALFDSLGEPAEDLLNQEYQKITGPEVK